MEKKPISKSRIKAQVERALVAQFVKFPGILPFLLKKLCKSMLILPYYHLVSDKEVLHVKHLYTFKGEKAFRDDLDFFLQNYAPLSLEDLLGAEERPIAAQKTPFHLTFDDGFSEQYYVIAPILKEKGVPATFFLVTSLLDNRELFYRHKASILLESALKANSKRPIGKIKEVFSNRGIDFSGLESTIMSLDHSKRDVLDTIAPILNVDFSEYLKSVKPYLTSDQVSDLIEDGFTIGAHSISHRKYTSLTLEGQLHETLESLDKIAKQFSLNYKAFAFPHLDCCVSRRYFEEIFDHGQVDISFGTSGIINDAFPKNFQRFSMEKTTGSTLSVVTKEYLNKFVRILLLRDRISRYG